MQKQKETEIKSQQEYESTNTMNRKNYEPKPRNIRKRFFRTLNERSKDTSFVFGNVSSLTVVTLFSLLYFSTISGPGPLNSTIPILYAVGGSFVGACVGAFFNGYFDNFKNTFDAFTSGIFQSLLLFLGLIPVGILSGASFALTLIILSVAAVVLPFANMSYSEIGKDFS